MMDVEISPDLMVAEVLERWPETIPVFMKHHLGCVGCAMAPFDALSDVAKIYNLRCDYFLGELRTAIREQEENDN